MTQSLSFENDQKAANAHEDADAAKSRVIVLVGLMGAGKSSVGKRLAQALDLAFVDSDDEIVKAASMSIPDIFKTHGEEEFRRLERRVIDRLMDGSPKVLATGGGAFMNDETRSLMKEKAVSVWLKADLETLWRRVSKKGGRPLLKAKNPKKVLAQLLEEREPIYAEADYTIVSKDGPHSLTVDAVRAALSL